MRETAMPKPLEPARFSGKLETNGSVGAATTPSRVLLERRIMLLSMEERAHTHQLRDKMEIPVEFSFCGVSPS